MNQEKVLQATKSMALLKCLTGISGFDEVTNGGLPRGRSALVCGGPGCGKTLFGMEFLVRGATLYGEPGVFISFEEREEELAANVSSMGFDLRDLEAKNLLRLDQIIIERSEIEEAGSYDLEGLFVRIGHAIDTIGAKRVVLDTIESLFDSLPNPAVLRSELRRLFRWLKDKGVTTVITGESGKGQLTRQGLEEYVSDSVTLLDHRVINGLSTRRLRVVKYRGSMHGTNEYPFLITKSGLSVLPVTSLGLNHKVSRERISSGIAELDAMLGGKGFYRGSTILLSGMAGAGKTSLAAFIALAACKRGERVIVFAFEESTDQYLRNMESVGALLEPYVNSGMLRHIPSRPTLYGLEMHLVNMHNEVEAFKPDLVVCDPLSALLDVGSAGEVKVMMTRLIDYLKQMCITAMFTNLCIDVASVDVIDLGISSLIDTWLRLRGVEQIGERNRSLQIIKSRGMSHSNSVREFCMDNLGLHLVDVYRGPNGILTGAARKNQLRAEARAEQKSALLIERTRRSVEHRRTAMDAEISALRSAFAAEVDLLAGLELDNIPMQAAEEDAGEGSAKDPLLFQKKVGHGG